MILSGGTIRRRAYGVCPAGQRWNDNEHLPSGGYCVPIPSAPAVPAVVQIMNPEATFTLPTGTTPAQVLPTGTTAAAPVTAAAAVQTSFVPGPVASTAITPVDTSIPGLLSTLPAPAPAPVAVTTTAVNWVPLLFGALGVVFLIMMAQKKNGRSEK